ncbi:MAG: class I SAM-dependent methyltransferase [Pseudoalteromonas prydzensis]|uniref:class I SAM-dependent methyltransferase n=1 Tax=Pseudoalteromonas prydzensis TaxID=182141 RepID=UPI003F9883CB
MSKHWSNYWEQGFLTSFGGAFKGNYQGELREQWLNFSSNFTENSKVLDIGTGNGALIDLIQQKKSFLCTGIDQANINNQVSKNISGHFLSGVLAENLPFKAEEFDIVIGQFAIEYSDLDLSIKEVFRVLKPAGEFVFVCHDEKSKIVLPNSEILYFAKSIKSQIMCSVRALANGLKEQNSEIIDTELKVVGDYIYEKSEENYEALTGTNLPIFFDFLKKNKNNNIDFLKAVRLFENELDLLVLRLSELVDAASKTKEVFMQVNSNNQDFQIGEIVEKNGSDLIAIYIKGRKKF